MSCTHNFGTGLSTCHCARCHETFTSITAFDMHQHLLLGDIACVNPAVLTKRDGSPALAVIRQTPDGSPVWGKPPAEVPRFNSPAEISRPNSPVADDGAQEAA